MENTPGMKRKAFPMKNSNRDLYTLNATVFYHLGKLSLVHGIYVWGLVLLFYWLNRINCIRCWWACILWRIIFSIRSVDAVGAFGTPARKGLCGFEYGCNAELGDSGASVVVSVGIGDGGTGIALEPPPCHVPVCVGDGWRQNLIPYRGVIIG